MNLTPLLFTFLLFARGRNTVAKPTGNRPTTVPPGRVNAAQQALQLSIETLTRPIDAPRGAVVEVQQHYKLASQVYLELLAVDMTGLSDDKIKEHKLTVTDTTLLFIKLYEAADGSVWEGLTEVTAGIRGLLLKTAFWLNPELEKADGAEGKPYCTETIISVHIIWGDTNCVTIEIKCPWLPPIYITNCGDWWAYFLYD